MSAAANPSAGSRITLRGALIALGVLLVIINVGSAVWDARTDRERTELRAQRDFSNLTSLLAEQTAAALEAVDLVLRDAVREGSAAKVAAAAPRLRDEISPHSAGRRIPGARRGRARRGAAPTRPPQSIVGLANRPFFTAHRDGRADGLFLSEPYQGRAGAARNGDSSCRAASTEPGGAFSGVIAAVMEIETFDRLYRAIDLGEGGFITLRSQEGTIITRVPDPAGARGREFPNPDIDAGLRREGRFTGWTMSPILNERILVAASAVRGFPMHILSGATERSVFAPWRGEASRIAARTLLTSVAMLVLIALAAWGLARRERALQRSEKRFRAMIERSSDVELLHDAASLNVIYASPSVERILGYTPEEMMQHPTFAIVHPEDLARERKLWEELLREPGKVVTTELRVLHKDGSVHWVENTLSNMVNEPDVQAVVMNLRDITERKLAEAERGRLEQRLRQAEKMEAVGRLAGGIAHDFNNILGGILGYAEMLFEQTAEGSPLKRYAQNVLTAANRARGLVDQILAYSRSQRGKRVPVDFGRIVAETLELIRGSLNPGMRLEGKLPATPVFVIGDPTQLHQILMNLCTNAIQAMGEDGTLRVALEAADAGAERALAHGTLQPGPYVRLTVEDTGPGMDEATIARIFEPFFTTKEVGKGTGLGLSLVYGIVTDSGGGIDVTSALGRGSTFTIYLPRVDTAVEVADENQGPVPRGNGERVLVVDDEESLVAVTSEVLLRLGYEPVGFSDSRAALAAFESAPERFDAAITDEVMPRLTGTELAALLRRRRADLPIVLVSGYIGPMLAERAHGAGVTEILKKPVQSREIAEALAHVLQR